MSNICYSTVCKRTGKKLTAGSFGGAIDQDTVERISRLFSVTVKPSGTAVFVDNEGREVSLHFYIDPAKTEIGKDALAEWKQEEERKWELEKQQIEIEQDAIERAMKGLSHAEIVRRLKGA